MSKRKAPSEDNINRDFCEFLIDLANYEKNVNRNIHKHNAYRKAAKSIAAYGKRISSGEEARKLDGVGKKIADKIDEFINTGKLRKLENIKKDETSIAVESLTRVSGIGPAKAQELFKLGIKSTKDLYSHKNKLNHHQLIGLKYLEDFEKKIPRDEIELIEQKIRSNIISLDSNYLITICGSYRRGRPESGDIDVLITHPSFTSKNLDKGLPSSLLKQVINKLETISLITDTISLGDVKFMGVCKIHDVVRRLDIRLTPHDQYHCATLYFTGSDMFNKDMRAHAIQEGFTLNEYCLRPLGSTAVEIFTEQMKHRLLVGGVPGEPLSVSSERDVFDYINFPFKEPHERN